MTTQQQYIQLLEAILQNIAQLRTSASTLLEARIVNHACFLMYTAIEEYAKALIVLDHYPKKLEKHDLVKAGYANHERKLTRLIRDTAIAYGGIDGRDFSKMATIIRNGIRESSLYVGFDGQVINPGERLSGENLEKLARLTSNCKKLLEQKIAIFQRDPFSRGTNSPIPGLMSRKLKVE